MYSSLSEYGHVAYQIVGYKGFQSETTYKE